MDQSEIGEGIMRDRQTVVVGYGNLTDMISDSMGAWRIHLDTGEEWSRSAAEAGTMWRAIGYVFGTYRGERYSDAFDFVSEQVKASPFCPAGDIANGLLAHMARWL